VGYVTARAESLGSSPSGAERMASTSGSYRAVAVRDGLLGTRLEWASVGVGHTPHSDHAFQEQLRLTVMSVMSTK